MNFINYKNHEVLTMKQVAELFDVSDKNLNRNFQRNKSRYDEGIHYFILNGDALKEFKKEVEIDLTFVSILYLWTKEGIKLLAKSTRSDFSWEFIEKDIGE